MAEANTRRLCYRPATVPPEDEVVITGIAGRFPDSDNVQHLKENLFNKVDLISSDGRRWKLDHPEIPQRTGKINNVNKFDALFFGVHVKQGHAMDPMCRMILEHAYEAIIDAGVNPKRLRGTRTGVFVGACFSESEKTWFYDKLQVNGFGITGCARAMLSNRVSYFLGLEGPSYTMDTACSSSLYALENAYRAMHEGLCDAAIVAAGNLCLHPYVSMQFFKLGVLSLDGRCKTFDESADGYVRSESISAIFLQKAKDAKRIYATVVHGKLNCDGYKEQGITFPSTRMQSVLLKEFYEECGVPVTKIDYIEAHGTGTRVGDPEEVKALDKVFCENQTRKEPLLIGSVKTNLGHSEPASGLCSVAKVIIAMETGLIPPHINMTEIRKDIKALVEGRIKVVTETTPWKNTYAGINSFGFGGANAHVLLKSNPKKKINNGAPNDDLPRLVVVSGRTEEGVSLMLNDLQSKPVDVEYVRLLHDIYSEDINGNMHNGYIVLPARGVSENPPKEIKPVGMKRPVWFVFSGMGSQWPGMGEALLRIPVFLEAIKKCDAVLKPRGIDIFHVITNKDKTAFDNILNSFVGIAAVQIGLVDVLTSIGIKPDNIIGHSVGELGCAYADGCFTADQMILSAYSRGLASIETKIIHGSMAAIGLGYKEIKPLCPPDIEVACHNSSTSATISGPAESLKAFVADLTAKKIFAREVACSNIPYHSRYIAPAGERLLSYLKKVIPDPKPRSDKWISTSVPIDKWDTPVAQLSSAEYHTNNLLNSVLFEETSAMIPKNAIAIEIAPHGLLQAILRRSLDSSISNIPLTQRGHKDNVEVLLQALGKMFNVGLLPQLANLYPHVEYPVSRSTQMISPLIKWEHSDDWFVTSYASQEKMKSSERFVTVSVKDSEYESFLGHVIDGRNLLPATGYLVLVWQTLAMIEGKMYSELSVVFEDIKLLRATNLPKEGGVELSIIVSRGNGRFEVLEGNVSVVTGSIRTSTNPAADKTPFKIPVNNEEEKMTSRDVYKELKLRGYHYSGAFRAIKSVTFDSSKGHLIWTGNWVAFMDNMLQMQILGKDTRLLYVPVGIKKIVLDPNAHLGQMKFGVTEKEFPVYFSQLHDLVQCGGIQIQGLKASAISRRKPAGEAVLEEYKFIPFRDSAEVSLREIVRLSTHIGLENSVGIKVRTVELIDETDQVTFNDLLSPYIAESYEDQPLIQPNVNIISSKNKFDTETLSSNVTVMDPKKLNAEANALFVVGHRLLSKDRASTLNLLLLELVKGGFILTRERIENAKNIEEAAQAGGFNIILEKKVKNELLVLLRKKETLPENTLIVKVNNEKFDWVNEMHTIMSKELEKESAGNTRIFFVGQGDFANGLMGLINCLKQEPGGEIVRGILIQDPKAPEFSLQNPLYAKQIEKDLKVCVLRANGIWGSYRHLPLAPLKIQPVYHFVVSQSTRGDLNTLKWFEGQINPQHEKKNLVNICYSSINFKDVMLATGKLFLASCDSRLNRDTIFGIEYSGVTALGERVMGLANARAMSNLIDSDPYLRWKVPDKWTLEEAATVPCVYATCIYGLYGKGNMKKGDKVLIHAGTGGVGQAAINLALFEGCEVFTTVGTPEKRKFIREHFPQIKDDHIGNSRDTSFEQMIKEITNGEGVDIVLNSLAEEKLLASVNCLAQHGRFLEIGKFDLTSNNPLGMEVFLREIAFHGVMLDQLFTSTVENKQKLEKHVSELLKKGAIKPLVRTVFLKDQIQEAFRFMAAGKHIGKVIIKIRDEKEPINSLAPAVPQYYCHANRSYIILGGLGGFGLELADWLVLRGARNLILTSRTGIKNGYQAMRINLWKSYGVSVVVVANKDASKLKDCQSIIETATKLAPVDGIFNLAVVLKDALWDNQTPEMFEESFRSKAWATKNLDSLSRKLCPQLRHFVVFSSVSCGRGNAGQTNYGMSNSVMERICEKRAAEGLPGLAIQWGAVGDVGLVAEMQEDDKELVIGGTLQQKITSCMQELNGFLLQNRPIVSSMVVAEKKVGDVGNLNIVDTVINIMEISDLKGVSTTKSFAELGMDSMMAVEIKQTLEREFEIFLTAQDIRGLTFNKLQKMKEEFESKEGSSELSPKADAYKSSNEELMVLVRLIQGSQPISPETCVRLSTKQEPGRSDIFLIPGIEGIAGVFDELTPKLKSPAICLQLGLTDCSCKTIFEMTDLLLPKIVTKCKDKGFFTLVGYSFGSMVAIELVRRLESEGLSGRLILIDGAPGQIQELIKQQMRIIKTEDPQIMTLIAINNVAAPKKMLQLLDDINTCNTWEEKTQAFTKYCTGSMLHIPDESTVGFCSAIYTRIVSAINYDASQLPLIKTPIVLMKPTIPTLRTYADDYNLSKVTRANVEIYYAPGNHLTIIHQDLVANAINGDDMEDPRKIKIALNKR